MTTTSFIPDFLVKFKLQKPLKLAVLDASGLKLAVLISFVSLWLPLWRKLNILEGVTRVSGVTHLFFVSGIFV